MNSTPQGHLYLSGFMGAGKSTVGALLADRLCRDFIDLDARIEQVSGRTVSQIFETDGEPAFRQLESAVLCAIPAAPWSVVSLGGGTAVDPENRRRLRDSGTLVTLKVSPETVLERLGTDSSRPLLQGSSTAVQNLLSERAIAYADADFEVETDGLTPDAVAEVAQRLAGLGVSEHIELGERSYAVHFRDGATAEFGCRIEAAARGKVLIISDDQVAALHAAPVLQVCRARGLQAELITFPAGERNKTLETVGNLYDACLAHGPDRNTPIVALGGGVTGDLAGFVAATLLRGVPYIQAPTTVLAQVDSSVGGKTGFNRGGKNLVGAFYQPTFVFADVAWLRTLDVDEARSGLGELIKHAALGDPELLDAIIAEGIDIDRLDWLEILPRAVRVKARIVEADEREGGVRALLNLGHTLGHAIESEAGYGALRHGEAVSIGMSFAAALSVARVGLPPTERDRLVTSLAAVGLPTDWRPWMRPSVVRWMNQDKKLHGRTLKYILLERLGAGRVERVALAEVAGWPDRVDGDLMEGLR